jgi:hypothetical protein
MSAWDVSFDEISVEIPMKMGIDASIRPDVSARVEIW